MPSCTTLRGPEFLGADWTDCSPLARRIATIVFAARIDPQDGIPLDSCHDHSSLRFAMILVNLANAHVGISTPLNTMASMLDSFKNI